VMLGGGGGVEWVARKPAPPPPPPFPSPGYCVVECSTAGKRTASSGLRVHCNSPPPTGHPAALAYAQQPPSTLTLHNTRIHRHA
jgi:hypothetical protein